MSVFLHLVQSAKSTSGYPGVCSDVVLLSVTGWCCVHFLSVHYCMCQCLYTLCIPLCQPVDTLGCVVVIPQVIMWHCVHLHIVHYCMCQSVSLYLVLPSMSTSGYRAVCSEIVISQVSRWRCVHLHTTHYYMRQCLYTLCCPLGQPVDTVVCVVT